MVDCGFPVIRYLPNESPRRWGERHGESFREAIAELVEIRTQLMREKSPKLRRPHIEELALQQWRATESYDADLFEELEGLRSGADLSITDLVILNNYTDFRDIPVPDQGCSVVFVSYDGWPIAGQTWDMHGSAKRYVCCLEVPCPGFQKPMVLFSLVGCVGMMGFHPAGHMVGVNNINTDGARAAVMWPAVVRKTLAQKNHAAMDRQLETAPVTSGHCYLLASPEAGEFWEVMPDLAERVERLEVDSDGFIFHTNHCLGRRAKARELKMGQNSTTRIRYDLIEAKIGDVRSMEDVYQLLNDHENYPKSICSNFQTDSVDPSITCGGAVGELKSGKLRLWRGDPVHDENFVCREFSVGANQLA